jgi:2-polyprenyl-3-methyl-5-hydroxy-6-metoxy-1,4-benzoquinol methylase
VITDLKARFVARLIAERKRWRGVVLSQRFGAPPSAIYDDNFYEHDVNAHQAASADDVAETLIELFSPSTVIDVGCGNGIYLQAFSRRNVWGVGCDGSRHGVRLCPAELFVFQYDLKNPLVVNRRFDLCICFEVAEHIPTRYSSNLVRSCCNTSDVVVFSSAPIGQGGTDHINEQPREFWDALFECKGFVTSGDSTAALQTAFARRNVVPWLTANARVYRRG